MSDETIVEDTGVTVTKAFDRDGFPVPAVTFRVESDRSDPVTVRIVDSIPDDFGIEQIGFHPEYGSEHWTATGEGVVRFERTVDSGEAFTTVYGVKMDDDGHAAPFLGAPTLEVDPEAIDDSAIEDVVPKESSDVVRELAGGERESVPGLDDQTAQSADDATSDDDATADASSQTTEDVTTQGDSIGAVADDDAVIIGENDGAQDEPPEDEFEDESPDVTEDEPDRAPPVDDDDILEAGAGTSPEVPSDDTTESDPLESEPLEDESPEPAAEPLDDDAADLAEQAEAASPIESEKQTDDRPAERASTDPTEPETAMNDELEETTPDEQDPEPATGETDVSRATANGDGSLAATLAEEIRNGTVDDDDLDAIRAAVEEPTTSDGVRVDHLQARLSDLEAYTDALETFLNEEGSAQELLDDLKETVETVGTDVEDLASRVDSAQGEREALRERVNSLADEMDAIDDATDRIDRIAGDLDALDERVEDGEQARLEVDSLEDELADLEDEIEDLEDEIVEFKEWRSQLSDLFN